jgi:hypothetical protein
MLIQGAIMHTSLTLNTPLTLRRLAQVATVVASMTAAAGAQAGGVYWSVNVDVPMVPVGRVVTAVSNAPAVIYRSAPVVVQQPQPVYYYGQPYGQPVQQVVYAPAPPVMVVPEPRRCAPPWWKGHHHHRDWDGDRGWDRWQQDEPVMVDPRQGRGDGRPEWRDDRRSHHN